MKKIIFILGIIAGVSIISCNKDEPKQEVEHEIKVENTQVTIIETESVNLRITSGNGGYKVASSNQDNVEVSIQNDILTIVGKKAGNTQVILVDAKFKKITIEVLVQELVAVEKQEIITKQNSLEIVAITKGVGPFKVESSDPTIATAEVNHQDKQIQIKPLQQGTSAVITLTDEGTKKTTSIHVKIAFNEFVVTQGKEKVLSIGDQYEVTSDDTGIASVNQTTNEIKVTGVAQGETTLTAKDKNTQETQKIEVKVVASLDIRRKRVEAIEGTKAETELDSGMPVAQYCTSEDESIAVFDSVGTQGNTTYVYIQTFKPGTTTVHISDGDTTIPVKVVVEKAPEFTISQQDVTVGVGRTHYGNYMTGSGDFEITIDDDTIAEATTPDNYGFGSNFFFNIKGKAKGTTTIRVKEKRNGEVKEIKVTVTD